MASFWYTILYVADVEQTLSFYEKTFGLNRAFITPEGDYGSLITWATTLSFARHDLARSNFPSDYQQVAAGWTPFGFEIAFVTDDISWCIQLAVQNGGSIFAPEKEKSWWQKVAYVRDPNGFLVEICSAE